MTYIAPTIDGYALWHRLHDTGGFTADPDTGEIPTVGFVVSLPEFEHVYPTPSFRPADVVTCLQNARQAALLYPEYHVYAGAWLDPAGHVVTDASIVVHSRQLAEWLCREWKQQAYFDLQSQSEVFVQTQSIPAA